MTGGRGLKPAERRQAIWEAAPFLLGDGLAVMNSILLQFTP